MPPEAAAQQFNFKEPILNPESGVPTEQTNLNLVQAAGDIAAKAAILAQ